MASDDGGSVSPTRTSQFYSVLEYFKAHVTAIVTLATGALVLSVSFIKDVGGVAPQLSGFLMVGWVFFTASIIAGVFYSYILTFIARDPENEGGLNKTFRNMLNGVSIVLHFSFMAGILCFLIFALANVPRTKKETPPAPSAATPRG